MSEVTRRGRLVVDGTALGKVSVRRVGCGKYPSNCGDSDLCMPFLEDDPNAFSCLDRTGADQLPIGVRRDTVIICDAERVAPETPRPVRRRRTRKR